MASVVLLDVSLVASVVVNMVVEFAGEVLVELTSVEVVGSMVEALP